ncbi:MAG: hypothetical protein Ct9H300mP4_16640 [Gammaproteobacteria bacterium]|nr:MAG: hypothetical protein Ct9H300mP4_16640 [Gammaproteobacteria bacterium]
MHVRNFLKQLTKATDIAIVIASALVVLAFLTSDYPESNLATVDKAITEASAAENIAATAAADLAIAKQVAEDVSAEALQQKLAAEAAADLPQQKQHQSM